jgi:hypothetical protein
LSFHADVAQLVEHHLAKVGVAGSNPVVRSKFVEITTGTTIPLVSNWPFRNPRRPHPTPAWWLVETAWGGLIHEYYREEA